MGKIIARKNSGKHEGTIMTPHINREGYYVATTSKFAVDQVYIKTLEEVETLYLEGYGLRMSNKSVDPRASYICHQNLECSDIGSTPSVSVSGHLKELAKIKELDFQTQATSRKEQTFLRLHLTKKKESALCTICGNLLPVDFLVAAHIKRRTSCSIEERLDFDNVATLMCKSGCDDLFEKGYIYIDSGLIAESTKKTTPQLKAIIRKLAGRKVSNWVGSKVYYEWHKEHFTK
ncbi:hypothetical protein FCV43_19725 [Vibrio genomosp. F6]|uniref:hypothetical protein n=1 Tax=Vibrio genomosp. F6 TaxID=723172 RepID=UPI0010BD2610|nr:hypothetical protein [Vibrio genomosp. F6]TKF14184.1 hypothetical protein FCV43_19725 [Vibrio genomosp. F6]